MPPAHVESRVWIPCPDCAPFHIRGPADALDLAVGWPDLPEFGLLMALLDADCRVEALVINPGPELVCSPDDVERPGPRRPVRAVALISADPATDSSPPGFSLAAFDTMQHAYRRIGIALVDWVHIDFERDIYRSMQSAATDVRGRTSDFLRAGTCL
jgi:hypothetical protein